MSNIENGRRVIKEFMQENSISEQDMAEAYGKSRVWIQRVLNGAEAGPAANKFILEAIRDFRIRKETLVKE